MKIAMIISTAFPPEEGIGYYVYNLSKKLMEKGHKVTIITRGSLKTQKDYYDGIEIIRVFYIPIYPFHVHIHGWVLNRMFKSLEKNFDLVHIHTPLSPIVNTNLPIISTIHGSMIGNDKGIEIVDFKSLASKMMTKISYSLVLRLIISSDIITTISKFLAYELREYYGVDRINIIGNAVDEQKFIPKNNNKKDYMLYVGRLSYGKGLFDLLKSVRLLSEEFDFKLFLIGKGELERKLNKIIVDEHIENNVKILGSYSHETLVEIYQNAKIFVFPSHYEGVPTVVLEAMASGLPVVLSDIPAHRYLIEDGENGILFKKGQSHDLYNKISNLLLDDSLRKKIGYNARKTIIENGFTWNELSGKFEALYESATDKR